MPDPALDPALGPALDRAAPLSILDLAPVVEGSTPAAALRNTLDLARRAEDLGYLRYWVAEHHFAPGVASSSPAVLIAAIAAVTSRIRVGCGRGGVRHAIRAVPGADRPRARPVRAEAG
jgi:Luciferase-like monooxygenase